MCIVDCENVGLLLRNLTKNIVTGYIIRNERATSAFKALVTEGGKDNIVGDNLFIVMRSFISVNTVKVSC